MLTDHSKTIIVVNGILPSLAVLAVILRLYARRLKHLSLRADDYTILGALVVTLGTCMPFIYCAISGGMGSHIENLTDNELVVFGKVTFWTQFPYIIAVSLIKLSILLFYRSIFSTPRFRLTVNILCAILLLWTIAFFFASLFQAWPISFNWNEYQPGHTIDEVSMYLALACSELALDVITLTLPWTVIWRLHMKTSQKLSILGIFMLGGLVCVSSVFRVYYYSAFNSFNDFTYESYNIFIWTAIEPCLGIVCACLPALAPIFQGGFSAISLFSNIRSYIRLRTPNSNKPSLRNDHLPQASKESSKSWNVSFLDSPGNAISLTDVQGRLAHDLEKSNILDEGILVHTEVSTSNDRTSL